MKLSSDHARPLGLGLLAVLLLGAIAFVMLRSGPLAPIRVTVAKVSRGSFTPSLFGIGTVEARRAYLIGPTAAGRVRRLLVDVGDSVKAGQLLAEMDPVDLDERLAALDASLARGGSAVASAQAQRQDAQAKKELATLNARRYEDLGEKNFISTGAVEAKLQEQTSANATLSAADANLAAARQDLQRLGAERAGLQQQRHNVQLLAPADGVVTSRDAEAGSTVVAGQPVLRVIEPASLWVRLRLDQGRSAGLATGLPAQIVLRSRAGQPLAGTVARVEAQGDSVTEERIAQVSFSQIPVGIAMGELAEVTLQTARPAPTLLLPNAAIKQRREQTGVWRLDDGHPVFAPVRTGLASLDGQVQVLEGLKDGDEVVVYSEKELTPQSRLKVVNALTKAAP
jgi:HlyD family secretion protein